MLVTVVMLVACGGGEGTGDDGAGDTCAPVLGGGPPIQVGGTDAWSRVGLSEVRTLQCDLTLDADGGAHLVSNGRYYARTDGWTAPSLEVTGYLRSVAVDDAGVVHFLAVSGVDVYHVAWDGSALLEEETPLGNVGDGPTLVADDTAHFFQALDGALLHSRLGAAGWETEEVAAIAGENHTVSAVRAPDGWIFVAWDDDGAIQVAHAVDGVWEIEATGISAVSIALAVGACGEPHLAWLAGQEGLLGYGRRGDAGWETVEITDGVDLSNEAFSLSVDDDGVPRVAVVPYEHDSPGIDLLTLVDGAWQRSRLDVEARGCAEVAVDGTGDILVATISDAELVVLEGAPGAGTGEDTSDDREVWGDYVEGGEDLPICELSPPNGRLDLSGRCVDGFCVTMSIEDAEAILGPSEQCTGATGSAFCAWEDGGVWVQFPDTDGDGDPDAGAAAWYIRMVEGFTGTTEEGLGLGVSLGCWLDALGAPDDVSMVDSEDVYTISELTWWSHGVRVGQGWNSRTGMAEMLTIYSDAYLDEAM